MRDRVENLSLKEKIDVQGPDVYLSEAKLLCKKRNFSERTELQTSDVYSLEDK